MKLVRHKVFKTFIEGKNEVLSILPLSTIAYFELSNCNNYEETFSKLRLNDVSIKVDQIPEGYQYKITFITDNYMYIQRLLSDRDWTVDEDECVNISSRDINMILYG